MGETVEELIQQLRHSETRESAEDALLKIGEPAVPALVKAMEDENEDARWKGKFILLMMGKKAVPGLIGIVGGTDTAARGNSLEILADIGNPAMQWIIEALEGEDEGARWAAAHIIEKFAKDKVGTCLRKTIPGLILMLGEENWENRERAAFALVEIGAPAVPALDEAMDSPHNLVRGGAVHVLGEIARKNPKLKLGRFTPRLIGLLGNEDVVIRRNAAEALGDIGDPSAFSALANALGDEDAQVRFWAVESLGKVGGASAVPALIGIFGDEDVRPKGHAIDTVGDIGDASAIPALFGVLADKDLGISWSAANALRKIDPRNSADLRLIANAARKAKKEGRPVDNYWKVYSSWLKNLDERADALVLDKKFHVPKVGKPGREIDKTERVLRVKRAV